MPDVIKIIRPGTEGLVIHGNATSQIVLNVGKPGPAGAAGHVPFVSNFAFGDASPDTLTTIPAGKHVYQVRLFIETPFDGTGAALSVGSVADPQELLATSENNPLAAGTYIVHPDKKYVSATSIKLTITPGSGASTGTGQLQIDIEP